MKKFYFTESFKKFYLFTSLSLSVPLWAVFFKRQVFTGGEAQEVTGLAMNQHEQKRKQWLERERERALAAGTKSGTERERERERTRIRRVGNFVKNWINFQL
jgi:hypothetical protein